MFDDHYAFFMNDFVPLCYRKVQCLDLLHRIFFLILKDQVFNEPFNIIYSL